MKLIILSQRPSLYSTFRLAQEAKKKKIKTQTVNHLKCKLTIEKDRPQVLIDMEELVGVNAIIPRIGASSTFYGAAVVRQFEMQNVYSCVSSDGLLRARDKLRCLQVLSKSGLNLPKTAFTNYSEDTKNLIRAIGGPPLIIKLLEGTQGLGVVLVETRKAAESVIEAFNKVRARIIVQEFIKESAGRDIRVIVIGGKVVAAMTRTAPEGEFRSNIHRGSVGEKIILNSDQEEAAIKAAAVMGLDTAGVDMLFSERGPLIMEVNASPGLEGIEKATGINVAEQFVKHILKSAR
ncbi:MAG: RimK family alpha-L-glutamate ligase [Flavobacteriales bacterium]|nr:RimK family alpha-L-glutamate ligase [Flavobacteriales bacterium]